MKYATITNLIVVFLFSLPVGFAQTNAFETLKSLEIMDQILSLIHI